MGNFLNTCETEKVSNYYWLHNLRRWENKIKINNYKINKNTNSKPYHINKLNNFIKNNNTNNPLNYVLNLKNENNELIKRFQKINL
jgi:hypothetical protein